MIELELPCVARCHSPTRSTGLFENGDIVVRGKATRQRQSGDTSADNGYASHVAEIPIASAASTMKVIRRRVAR